MHIVSSFAATDNNISATELDSHADSPVIGRNATILEVSNKTAMVSGFTTELGAPMKVPIVTAAVMYDCEYSGSSYVLIVHNALHFKNMDVNLIPPIMMRIAGLEVDECPKFLARTPNESNHSIYFPVNELRIPLCIEGLISYIPTREPTIKESNEKIGEYVLLAQKLPSWDPHTHEYRDQEYRMIDYNGNIKSSKLSPTSEHDKRIMLMATDQTHDNAIYDPIHFINRVSSLQAIQGNQNSTVVVMSTSKKGNITPEQLAKRLNVPY